MVTFEVVDNMNESISDVVADHFFHYFKNVDSGKIKDPVCKKHEYSKGIIKHTARIGGYLVF